MDANYHTHTVRCRHAIGSEREYIEKAISRGFKKLGFSDHTPQPYPSNFVSGMRMQMVEFDNYVNTIKNLAREYAQDITIYTGLEVEFMPEYFDKLINEIQQRDIDYIIMGQHFVKDEINGFYAGEANRDEKRLQQYVDLVVEGLASGKFTYLAHPDLINYIGPDKLYQHHMCRICEAALANNIPLEVNMLGFETKRNYPCDRFFTMAQEMGCSFVIGCDAHNPDCIFSPEELPDFMDFLKKNKISYNQDIKLIKP